MPDQAEAPEIVTRRDPRDAWWHALARLVREVAVRGTARSRECRITFDHGETTVVVLVQRVEP